MSGVRKENMEKIRGVYLSADDGDARVIEFDNTEARPSELLGCFFTGTLRRRIRGKRYLFTFSSDAQSEPMRVLSYDDRLNGIYGDVLITDISKEGTVLSISEDSRLNDLLDALQEEQGKTICRDKVVI